MSHTDEPASTQPPPGPRAKVRKRDAILDALHRYHRALGAVVAAAAALSLNGPLLSGFDTAARRATQSEVAAQKATQGVEATQQAGVQKKEVRVVGLPPVQIVGRRLPPAAQLVTAASPSAVIVGATAAPVQESTASAPLTFDVTASPRNAGQGFTASRVRLLLNSPLEQKPAPSAWASTQP